MGKQSDWVGEAHGGDREKAPGDAVVISGVVEAVVYASPGGDFVVADVVVEGRPEPVRAVGDFGDVTPGQPLKLTGRFGRHPRFGLQFQATSVIPVLPRGGEGVFRYLCSGAVKGVGKKTARKIVDALGAEALARIADDPDALRSILGKKTAQKIRKQIREKRDEAEVLSVLAAHGIGTRLSRKIRERYGDRAMTVVRKTPYRLAVEIEGVGFRRADLVARAAGIAEDDPARAAAAVMHALREASEEGHVLLPVKDLVRRAEDLRVPAEHAPGAVEALRDLGHVVVEGTNVYLTPLHAAEVGLARRLAALARPRRADPAAARRAEMVSASLAEKQREAVRATLDHGLVVLTGGPGTGKTTTLRAVVALHGAARRNVALCAPTGRAAKRMSEAARMPARTIHRLLEWSPTEGRFARDADCPVEADLVVVDEASMLDVPLAHRLFDAIPERATVLLVGDVDQLPPVGPGAVLRDVIDSGRALTVRLTEVFRQAAESRVVTNAHRVNRGDLPVAGPKEGDFHVIHVTEPERAAELVVSAVSERIPRAFGIDPRDVMVLSPMRKGPIGVVELNRRLQAELNRSPGPPGALRVGDRVMQLKNDYEHDIFNGDVGIVRRTSPGFAVVDFDGREVELEGDALSELTLAYASTIHKAQGSEFPAVVVALGTGHHVMLARNLLYTAITRARRLVVLVAHPLAVRRAVENARAAERHGRLRERLAGP